MALTTLLPIEGGNNVFVSTLLFSDILKEHQSEDAQFLSLNYLRRTNPS